MKYCRECGEQLAREANFCLECGTKVVAEAEHPAAPEQTAAQTETTSAMEQGATAQRENHQEEGRAAAVQPSKRKLSPQGKLGLIAIAIVIVIAVITHQVGATLTDKDRMIAKLGDAFVEKDVETFMSLVQPNDPRLTISEQDAAAFLEYVEKNPSAYRDWMEQLRQQSLAFDEDSGRATIFSPESLFQLKKVGKTAFIFDRYAIEIIPFYLHLETYMEGAKIFLNGEEIAEADKDHFSLEYGPLLPGVYTVEAKYEAEYAYLETKETVSLFDPHQTNVYVFLELYGDYVTIYADYEELELASRIYINGNNTDVDLMHGYIGPVQTDGTLQVFAEIDFPWGTMRTEEALIDDTVVYLSLPSPLSEEEQTAIVDQLHQFGHEWAEALEALDATKVTTATTNFMPYVEQEVDYLTSGDYYWEGRYVKGLFDVDSLYVYENDGHFYASIAASLTYEGAYYFDEEDVPEIEEYRNIQEYHFVYDEETKQWLLDDYIYSYDFAADTGQMVERLAN